MRTLSKRWAAIVVLLPIFAPGCAARALDRACERACDCYKGDAQTDCSDACLNNGEDLQELADEAGCSGELEDYFDCAGDAGTCQAGGADVSACDEELAAFEACGGGDADEEK